ncbi:hypothetical protein ONZ45_g19284 [Pleurotus djamor]|nr:hypothetical protein ONZ45_g19284 [Pleurotus djamor]
MHIEVTVHVEEVLKDGVPVEPATQAGCKVAEIIRGHSSPEHSAKSPDDLARSRLVYLKLQRLEVKDICDEEDEETAEEDAWSSAVSEIFSSDEELGWSSAASHCSDSDDEEGSSTLAVPAPAKAQATDKASRLAQ